MENDDTFLKFKKLLKFVFENKYSNFYRLKYEKASFNPDTDFNAIGDVKKIPLLSKEELAKEDSPRFLFIPEDEVSFISPSAGTTSGKPIIVFHPKDHLGTPLPKGLEINYKKILLLHNSFRIPLFYHEYKQLKPAPMVLVGDVFNLSASCQLASKLKVNVVRTTPTIAIILKKHLINYPDFQKSLRVLSLGGEIVGKEKRKLLRKLYPSQEIIFNYGLAETAGSLGIQCCALSQREKEILYHIRPNDCYYEIINPSTEEEVPFGETGELVITNFRDQATPLIRYRTGDMASFSKNDCSCGLPGPLLKIHGRINYDIIRVGGFELHTEMLEKPLLNLSSFLKNEFEAHIYENFVENKPRIQIKLNLSLKEGIKESPELKQKIGNELLENWQLSPRLNLKKAVEAGLFEIPQINFVQFPLRAKARQVLILH